MKSSLWREADGAPSTSGKSCRVPCRPGAGMSGVLVARRIPAGRTGQRRSSDALLRAATALRSFYFFQRIERLELEARRLSGLTGEGPAAAASRKHIVNDVGVLRRDGEVKSYIDLLFLALVVVLCVSKIVTD